MSELQSRNINCIGDQIYDFRIISIHMDLCLGEGHIYGYPVHS